MDKDKQDNLNGLSTSLLVECPILSRETADKLAADLIASEDGWRSWEKDPPLVPRFEQWVIVGKDVLGYVHNATHLAGKAGGPFDFWKRVQI